MTVEAFSTGGPVADEGRVAGDFGGMAGTAGDCAVRADEQVDVPMVESGRLPGIGVVAASARVRFLGGAELPLVRTVVARSAVGAGGGESDSFQVRSRGALAVTLETRDVGVPTLQEEPCARVIERHLGPPNRRVAGLAAVRQGSHRFVVGVAMAGFTRRRSKAELQQLTRSGCSRQTGSHQAVRRNSSMAFDAGDVSVRTLEREARRLVIVLVEERRFETRDVVAAVTAATLL